MAVNACRREIQVSSAQKLPCIIGLEECMASEHTVENGFSRVCLAIAILAASTQLGSAKSEQPVRHVTARVPVVGKSIEIGAVRPNFRAVREPAPPLRPSNTWTKLATLPNATVHDVAFVSPTVGYAAAELGQIWQTKNGGNTWQLILNRGFPYYYYGIAVFGQKVIASGFDD